MKKFVLLLTLLFFTHMRTQSQISNQPSQITNFSASVDAFMEENMDVLHVPGAAVVIVQGDEILLSKGYGSADLGAESPAQAVDAAATVFRAGSVSKLFTATAVMQLVERGQVDLHTDVNQYLKHFQIPNTYPEPITLAHLLTHTAGFDEHFLGMHVRLGDELPTLGDYLAESMPPRTSPPGQFISYNDYGMSLAGFIVEEVTGIPFAEYIQQQTFTPLGMEHSTFQQPPPAEILEALATGYGYKNGEYTPYAYDYNNVSPAAALLTTADDMAKFIIAHLNGGAPLLNPDTTADMHARQITMHPLLRGRAYGFSEMFINGQRALFHDGGNPGFISRLILIPEQHLGFFITANIDQYAPGGRFNREFTTVFFNRAFPASSGETNATDTVLEPLPIPADFATRAPAYTGYYRPLQGYASDTLQKLTSLTEQFPVKANADGTLSVFGDTIVEVESNLFRWTDDPNYVAFRTDEDGQVTHLFVGTGVNQKLAWYEALPAQITFVAVFLITFLSAIVISIFWGGAFGTGARLVLGMAGALNLIFLIGVAITMTQTDTWEFLYGIPPLMKMLLAIPLLTSLLALVLVFFGGQAWLTGNWPLIARVYYIFAALVAVGFVAFLNFWNLLGWRA